jgi:NADH-quinone oxidoreductase subunit L
MTHAFFKALLFLAAGSVIIGMHHEQDIRNMGGLRRYMPITWITALLGTLALVGTPFFSGFYSKDAIIESVRNTHIAGAGFAYFAVVLGVFVTAFYSFRMYFLVFHGKERFGAHAHAAGHGGHGAAAEMPDAEARGRGDAPVHVGAPAHGDSHGDAHGHAHGHAGPPQESPAVVTMPLVLLAIPSVLIGLFTIAPMLFGDFFEGAITMLPEHAGLATFGQEFHGWLAMGLHGFVTLPFWLALAGAVSAWYCYLVNPRVPAAIAARFAGVYRVLDNKYYFDRFNDWFFAGGARLLGTGLWKGGDQAVIDGVAIDGSARLVGWFAGVLRLVQSGYVYHYAIAMIVGVALLVWWFVPLIQR